MFVKRLQDGQEAFQELKTNLDTVWLFPEFQRGVALFRGVTATTDEECEDISTLMAAFEPLETAPLPVTHYMELPEEAAPAGATPEPAQPEQPEDPEEPQAPAKQAAPPDLSEMEKEVGALQAKVTDHLKSIGVTEKQAMDFMVQKEKEQALQMEEAMAILGGADAGLKEMVANLEKATTAHLDKLGVSREQALEFLRDKEHPPDFKIKEIQDGLQQTLDNNPGLDAETRGKITEAIAAYGQLVILLGQFKDIGDEPEPKQEPEEETPLSPSIDEEEREQEVPEFTPLTREQVMERHARGESLSGADLSGLDLSGLNLQGIDLRKALLLETNLTEANLSKARLGEADCTGALCPDANLEGADLTRTVLAKARLEKARARGCLARETVFTGADCSSMDLREAHLELADFTDAVLTEADLSQTSGEKVRFYGAKANSLKMMQAKLTQSRADENTDFAMAAITDTDLTGSNWCGASLEQARLHDTLLDAADLSKVNFSRAFLRRVSAKNADLAKARFAGAELVGFNGFQSSFRRADLLGARIEDANLFGADLFKCRLDPEALLNVNVKRTFLRPGALYE